MHHMNVQHWPKHTCFLWTKSQHVYRWALIDNFSIKNVYIFSCDICNVDCFSIIVNANSACFWGIPFNCIILGLSYLCWRWWWEANTWLVQGTRDRGNAFLSNHLYKCDIIVMFFGLLKGKQGKYIEDLRI